MLLSWHLLSPCLILLWLCSIDALCPSSCTCKQSEKGKRKVSCTSGNMIDPIPTKEMDPSMEVLEIIPQDSAWNTLVIAPVFQSFKLLEEIRIKRSNILQIGMHPFWGVPTLKVLDLSFNNISAIHDHNFRGLLNLIELNLDNNNIKTVQSGAFKHLTELRILSLQRNLLKELVPRMFLKIIKLHVLKLSGNKFEDFHPEVFKDIPELRVLECRNCNIRRINTQIYHLLPYISHLDLGENQMTFLDTDEFVDLHKLHSLKLDGNFLSVILEKTFAKQQQLKVLCLSRNRIVKITDGAFYNLTNLTELDISYNKLIKVDSEAFMHVSQSLQKLKMGGNKLNLTNIKGILQTLNKLWYLDIGKMNLKILPEFYLPSRIKKLNVSHNNLTDLTIDMLPKELAELDISNNKLKGLDEILVTKLEEFKQVILDGNPWSCDLCYLTPMLFRLNRTTVFKNLTCASPKLLAGRLLSTIQIKDVTTCKKNVIEEEVIDPSVHKNKLILIIGVACLTVFLILCVLFVIISCMRRRVRHTIEEEKRSERRQESIEDPTAVFCKGEISFKFPLDLTERKVSVSTIDEIKKDTQLQTLPNGTGI